MTLLFLLLIFVIMCFGYVLLFGAPYLPTLTPQVTAALDMLDLKPGQRLIELGSGDGKVMLAAVKRGYHVTGYEINPILVLISRWRLRKYKGQARVVLGNFWTQKWPETDGIFSFNLQRQMQKLDKKIVQECRRPVKLASFAFYIEGKEPVRKEKGIFLYQY